MMRAGIDLGGTKIEAIALDKNGKELFRKRTLTPQGNYDKTLHSIAALVLEIEKETKFKVNQLGIGVPGTLSSHTGLIKNSNSICLIGRPLDKDLSKLLGRPIRLANDANCFALSEAVDGSGQHFQTVFGVILGTGVGGGLVVDKKILAGCNGVAGEWGHNPLPWATPSEVSGSPLCYCGKKGCIETFLSGPSLARDHLLNTSENVEGPEIYSRFTSGDLNCKETLLRYASRLARGLASLINVFDPDAIVLGGGLSNIDFLYEAVPQIWTDFVFSDHVNTKLLKAQHGDSSGIRGAAWLFSPGDLYGS